MESEHEAIRKEYDRMMNPEMPLNSIDDYFYLYSLEKEMVALMGIELKFLEE